MRYPTNWISITQGFHVGKHLDFGWCGHHGQAVYACDAGVVKKLEYQEKSGGNVIYIQHDNGLVSSYAHLKSYCVKQGQRVELGQQIGIMGDTGVCTGEHLDFALYTSYSVRYKNSTVNPFDYLEVYPNQEVRKDTQKKYGADIKYYNPTPSAWTKGTYQLLKKKAVRREPHLGNNIKKVQEAINAHWADSAMAMLVSKKPKDDIYLKAGSQLDISEIIDEKGRIWGRWGKTGNDYVVLCNIDGTAQAIKVK